MWVRVGTIETGKQADIATIVGNPLDDISDMMSVRFVKFGGKVVRTEITKEGTRMIRMLLSLTILFSCVAASATDQGDSVNIYLITHSEVSIEASQAEIWPFIVDTSEWKTLATSTRVSGNTGEYGEIRLIKGGEGASAYQFWTKVIELVPQKRKVIAIYFDEQAKGDVSYAAWTLFTYSDSTMVTYDVYSVNRMADIPQENVASIREQVTRPNKTRFDQELQLLKRLVEE